MIKIVFSPLFFIIIAVVAIQINAIVRIARGKRVFGNAVLTLVCIGLLALCSTAVFNRLVYLVVEHGVSDQVTCPVDVVMVLGGGYYPGREEKNDVLNDESISRVKHGVEVYHTCNAKFFVVSGRTTKGKADRNCTLMAELAKGLGVPESNLILETESRNSRDHPLFLEKLKIADKNAMIAVVTSPWHMKRAMREFERAFPNAIGVAAYPASYVHGSPIDVLDWMPMALALERTTRPIHEIIGIAWYKIANTFQDKLGIDIDQYRK